MKPEISTAASLQPAYFVDYNCIENMMQFYNYDLSEWIPLSFNASGRFSIKSKLEYLSASTTHAFIIKINHEIIGFTTVDQESTEPEIHFNLGYLFICRQFRGRGIARKVIAELILMFSGNWQIFYIQKNTSALAFWNRVIPQITNNQYDIHQKHLDGYDCVLYKFSTLFNQIP